MCLAIVKRADQDIKREYFADVWKKNNDGVGMTWLNRRGQPTMWKGLSLDDFYLMYEKVKHKELLIHFRFTTVGLTNHSNAHPHKVLDDVYMVHNGSFGKFSTSKEKSDTVCFVEEIVRPLLTANGGAEYLRSEEFMKEIIKYTSRNNRLAFMDKNGLLVIEPHFWSKTLTGLQVSNEYAYTMDNPTHVAGYASRKNNHYYDDHHRYGMGHNSSGNYCEFGDDDWRGDSNSRHFRNAAGEDGATVPLPVKKDPPLTLITDNTKKDSSQLDIKNKDSVSISDFMWFADASNEEIEDMLDVDRPLMAKVFKAALKEIQEYGYSAEKFRLGGGQS